MNELPWASPEALGRLTISQILSIGHDRPPGAARPMESFAELEVELARVQAAEASEAAGWAGP